MTSRPPSLRSRPIIVEGLSRNPPERQVEGKRQVLIENLFEAPLVARLLSPSLFSLMRARTGQL